MKETNGGTLRNYGRSIELSDRKAWDDESAEVMKELMLESFKANPAARDELLRTQGSILTHKYNNIEQDGGRFSRVITEVRDILSGKDNESFDLMIENIVSSKEFYNNPANEFKACNV